MILTFWLISIISISSRLMKRLNVSSMSLTAVSVKKYVNATDLRNF